VTVNYEDNEAQKTQVVKIVTEKEYKKETSQLTIIIMLAIIIILILALLIIVIRYMRRK
jgi:flagellar biogenesis protein FliO